MLKTEETIRKQQPTNQLKKKKKKEKKERAFENQQQIVIVENINHFFFFGFKVGLRFIPCLPSYVIYTINEVSQKFQVIKCTIIRLSIY